MDRYSRKVQWDVKRSVCLASAFYLFYYGGKACLYPFLTLYFRQIGLSASQTGLALGIKAFLWFCVSPIWMAIAHRLNKTRTLLCYSIFIVIGSNLALTLLPPADPKFPLQVCLNESPPFPQSWHNESTTPQDMNIVLTTVPIPENLTSLQVTTTLEKQDDHTILPTVPPTTKILPTVSSTTKILPTTTTIVTQSTQAKTVISPTKSTTETTTITNTIPSSNPETSEYPSSTTTVSTTSSTSTTTKEHTTSTVIESPYKLARELGPKLEKQGYTSDNEDDISDFVSKYKDTENLPRWKQQLVVDKIMDFLEEEENESPRHGFGGGSPFRHRLGRRASHFGARKKRNSNETENPSSGFDINNYVNFTSLSEKKDAALKNLTHSLKNFAKEIRPYLSSNTYLFSCVVIILVVGELLSAPVELVSDNSLYNLLDELDSLNQYGKHRISALVGAALCGITVSIIVYFSPCFINGTINRFHIHFYLFALLLGIAFILAPFFPSYDYDPACNSARGRITGNQRQKCSTCTLMICSNCRHFLLLVTIFIVGITQAPMQNFMLWMVQDMEGSSELVYGSFVSANAICAMMSSLFGRKLIKILKPCTVAMISLMSIALQLILYAFIPSPWLIIPLQLFNITGLSFLWTIVSHHTSTTMSSAYEGSEKISSVHVFARASQQRTLHATYVSVYQGLSFSIGSIMSGFVYDFLQGKMAPLLIGSGILVAIWGLIFTTYQCCCLPRKQKRKYSHLISDSDSDVNQVENREFGKKYTEKNGNYYSVRDAKKRRDRSRKRDIDSNSSDTDEHDWLKATMKKESRML